MVGLARKNCADLMGIIIAHFYSLSSGYWKWLVCRGREDPDGEINSPLSK